MKPGMRTSSFPGDIEEAILDLNVALLPGGGAATLAFRPAPGYGGRAYGVYLNGRRHTRAFVAEGQAQSVPLVLPPDSGDFSVQLEDLGDWADAGYDADFAAQYGQAASADRISASWHAAPQFHPRGTEAALAQLANWSLTGLKRFSNCAPLPGRATRAVLSCTLAINGATRTVTLWAGGTKVAEGARTGNGTLALAPVGNSGLSGTVSVAADAGIVSGDYTLEIRYPHSYEIHFATAPLQFPRAPQQVVRDDGTSNQFRATTEPLPAGTYYVAVLSVSDTGAKAASAAAQQVTLAAAPQRPTDLAYSSGDAGATVIAWTASATPGATYRIYDSELDGPVNLDTPAATEAAGSGTRYKQLAPIAYPGKRRVMVRAVNGSAEEKNAQVLTIEYDSEGHVVGARPNSPRIRDVSVSAGRQITVRALYFAAGQAVAPAAALLFVVPEGSALDYAAPADAQAFGEEVGGVRVATLSATAPTDGFFTLALRAASAAGTQDLNTATERIHVTLAAPPAAGSVEIAAARG